MTEFAVVDARPWHCGQMLRCLRQEQRAVVARLGVEGHRQLRDRYEDSSFKRAWMLNGRLAGLGGVTGSMAASVGMIWLALSQDAARHPVAIVREARRQIARINVMKREIVALILEEDPTSLRFADRLGFVDTGDRIQMHGDATAIVMTYREAA